jgi:hypothetical protein
MSNPPEITVFRDICPSKNARVKRSAERWDKFLTLASDGEKRTSSEIRKMMGFADDVHVTAFLRSIKFRLVVDRTDWRLKVSTRKGLLVWQLQKK